MNLGDPQLELTDPTPNIHTLFTHFDETFFRSQLVDKVDVKWSKRMFFNAGICWFKNGCCKIVLSEPLLKLRPRKNLVETLLHEMIHAYLFLTDMQPDRDYHGFRFQAHMHRINNSTGLNISVNHDFHEEVGQYLAHWWRCNGPCQDEAPNFGIIRKFVNRAPGPSNHWWEDHRIRCGGTFIKIKTPERHSRRKPSLAHRNITVRNGRNKPNTIHLNDTKQNVQLPSAITSNSGESEAHGINQKRKLDVSIEPTPAKIQKLSCEQ